MNRRFRIVIQLSASKRWRSTYDPAITVHYYFSGSVREGDELMLGPCDDGLFQKVKVKTVHRHRLPCRLIQAGQASTVAIEDVERGILRKVCIQS